MRVGGGSEVGVGGGDEGRGSEVRIGEEIQDGGFKMGVRNGNSNGVGDGVGVV